MNNDQHDFGRNEDYISNILNKESNRIRPDSSGPEGESKAFKYCSSVATQNYKAISGDDSIGRREIIKRYVRTIL